MRIMIINPDYGMTREEMDERVSVLRHCAGEDIRLTMDCLHENHVTIDSALDVILAGPEIISMARRAEREGYDAVVLYCFSDPAVDACREAVRIPVIGGGQAAYLTALTVSRQFGLLVTDPGRIPEKRLFAGQAGIQPERVISFRAVDLEGRRIHEDREHTLDCLERTGRRMVDEDGAQAVILGCLSFLGFAGDLEERLGVPVIDGAMACVALAAAAVRQGLHTGKRAYPYPPAGERSWSAGKISVAENEAAAWGGKKADG